MTLRRLAAIWGAAVLVALLVLGGLGRVAAGASSCTLPDAPVVAIGSSLLRFAMPPRGLGGADALLGDGRAHVRLSKSSIREEEVLDCLDTALHGRTEVVLLELNVFGFDFSHTPRRSIVADMAGDAPAAMLLKASRRMTGRLRALSQPLAPPSQMLEEANFDWKPTDMLQRLRLAYPLVLHDPSYRSELTALLERARANGVRVVLVAPPRSLTASRYLGAQADELKRHLQRLADELGEPLFMPGPDWPNDLFIDRAHLNLAGRERFLGELRAWWKMQA